MQTDGLRTASPRADTPLLRRLNERRVLDAILAHGPLSRTALRRAAAMTGPTVTKAAESLLRMGLLEELDAEQVPGRLGRPERRLRLASRSTEVIGIVIDARRCTVVPAGRSNEPFAPTRSIQPSFMSTTPSAMRSPGATTTVALVTA